MADVKVISNPLRYDANMLPYCLPDCIFKPVYFVSEMPFSHKPILILLIFTIIGKLAKSARINMNAESESLAAGNNIKDIETRHREVRSVINVKIGADAARKLISGATKIHTSDKYANVYEKSGGLKAAITEFKALNPTQVETVSYGFGQKMVHGFVGDRYVQLATHGRLGKPEITSLKLTRNEKIEKPDKIIYVNR